MLISKKNMFLFLSLSALALAIVVAKLQHTHASQYPPLIPLRDFFKNTEKSTFKLSPDGNYLSYLAPDGNRMNIFIEQMGHQDVQRITSATDRDIRTYFWKNNDLLMYLMDNKGGENFHLLGVSKDGSNIKDFTPGEGFSVRIIDELQDNEDHILISTNKRDKKVFDVYRLNIKTGTLDLIAQNPGNILRWLTDHEGKLRIAVAIDGTRRSVLYRDSESESFRPVQSDDFRNSMQPLFFTFDNKQLYVLSNINRDKVACAIFDPSTQQEVKLIYEHPDYDVNAVHFSRKRKVLTDIEYLSWKHEHVFLDSHAEARYHRLEQICKECDIYVDDYNKNEDKFIIRTEGDRSPATYYFYDRASDTLTELAKSTPYLHKEHLAHVKPIKYTSRDGLTIHGYLTLPLGKEPKNIPVVINPHGGPWCRYTWSFNPEFQFLANRGYAVLTMNFRGSTGYGKKFWELSFKQWGQTMQDDITDGVKWLIDSGIADPKKIAIYGGSYAGYTVLAGLAFTPELYACGIDLCGESNLFTFMKSIPEYWKVFDEISYEQIGHPEKDKELFMRISPVFHVDKIRAPLFIAQGRMDPRVNINESDQMVEALKNRGVEVEYMVKDNEGHGFSNEENRFDFYEALEKFLDQHLKA